MKILKIIIHNHYFWISLYCLYAVMLFLILPDDMSIKNQIFIYIASAGFVYWVRAFILNKEISVGIASFPPNQGHDIIRTAWFLMCIYGLIVNSKLTGISLF